MDIDTLKNLRILLRQAAITIDNTRRNEENACITKDLNMDELMKHPYRHLDARIFGVNPCDRCKYAEFWNGPTTCNYEVMEHGQEHGISAYAIIHPCPVFKPKEMDTEKDRTNHNPSVSIWNKWKNILNLGTEGLTKHTDYQPIYPTPDEEIIFKNIEAGIKMLRRGFIHKGNRDAVIKGIIDAASKLGRG